MNRFPLHSAPEPINPALRAPLSAQAYLRLVRTRQTERATRQRALIARVIVTLTLAALTLATILIVVQL